MTTTAMLDSHPAPADLGLDVTALAECIDACAACATACSACADACLAEEMVAELRSCVRTDLDCADICATTARVLARRTGPDVATLRALVETCATACQGCGDECASHAEMHEHCRICAEACRRCESACRALLESL